MRSDLDGLMAERGIDALVVSNHEHTHPAFVWLSRGAKVTRGYIVKKRGADELLIHYPMERDEAFASGVPTRSIFDFGHAEIFRESPNPVVAYAKFFGRVFRDLGIHGPVAFNGFLPVQLYFDLLQELESSGFPIFRAAGEDLVQLARKRKEPWELEKIASVGRRTEEVVESVRKVLRAATIRDGVAHYEGKPLMLGDLKTLTTREIVRLGMLEDHETILSQGRDAGVPHSRGTATDPVKAGLPIIMDIFPVDRESGYFFDLTRTFCIGDIPDELAVTHQRVLEAFNLAAERMTAGTEAQSWQAAVCDYFEGHGYATLRTDPATHNGYVHSLGHGVGLQVHEKPFFHINASNKDRIEVGDVLTIEPGLYFPEKEIGVRIEDTFYINEDGRAVTFCASDRGLRP